MKKILCLFAIALMMVSCGTTSSEASYIPKDATGVMYINLGSLSKKSDDVDFKSLSISKMMEESAPREIKEFMNTQMTAENMKATFRNEFILGFMTVERMSPSGGLIIPIKDAASFQKMIQPILDKASRLEKQENVGKGKAFTVYSSREMAIGWNDKTALIIGAKNFAGQELIDLTNLDASKSITATNYFSDFFDGSKDMGLHITSTPMSSVASAFLTNFKADIDLENNNFMYHTNFEDDRLYTSAKLKMNDDIKSLIGYKSWMSSSYDASLLDMMPKDVAMLMKLSIDPTAMYKHIESLQDNAVLPEMIRAQIKMGVTGMNSQMKSMMGMTMEEASGIFEGTMMLGVTEGVTVKDSISRYNYNTGEYESKEIERKIPNIYAAISIKDQAKFDTMLGLIMQMERPMATKGKDYYQLEKDLFVVVKNSALFITNNGSKADEIFNNGKLGSNLSNFEHKNKLDNSMYTYVSTNFTKMYGEIISSMYPYGSYSGRGGLDFDAIGQIYGQYFGDGHVTMNTNGMEMYSYTKGEGNSLVRMIMYTDAVFKEATKMMHY